jgi:N-acetylglutamate synthase-like GNAT family acetyltransferase
MSRNQSEKVVIEHYQEIYHSRIIEIFTAGQWINNISLPPNETEAYIAFSISTDLSEIHKIYPNSFWVAKLNDEIIGCVGLELKANKKAELRRMVVDPKYHRLGVGTKLICCLETYARESGVELIFLSSLSAAVGAVEFYNRLGFVIKDEFTKPKITNESEVWKLSMLEKKLSIPQISTKTNTDQITIENYKESYRTRLIEMLDAGLKHSMAIPIAELDAYCTPNIVISKIVSPQIYLIYLEYTLRVFGWPN